jgi:hypothetical protein
MGEPLLCMDLEDQSSYSYRFLWLRTFHQPVTIRMDIRNDFRTATLTAKVTDGKGGYESGKLVFVEKTAVTEQSLTHVLDLVDRCEFWDLPSIDRRSIGFDGAQWIIEGRRGGKYHLVDRWSPEPGPFRELALTFLDLAKVDAKNIY